VRQFWDLWLAKVRMDCFNLQKRRFRNNRGWGLLKIIRRRLCEERFLRRGNPGIYHALKRVWIASTCKKTQVSQRQIVEVTGTEFVATTECEVTTRLQATTAYEVTIRLQATTEHEATNNKL
jgi:hypothetical protein